MLGSLSAMSMSPERLEGYPRRCERIVAAMAQACALEPAAEVERFQRCRDTLGPLSEDRTGDDLMGRVASMLGNALPLQFEFVLTYADGAPRGFAYMTQGRASATLPLMLSRMLEGALRLHVGGGSDPAESELLVEQFKLAFPRLDALTPYSPMAQGMIIAVAAQAQRTGLKVYFNTRLDTSLPHRDRVLAMLARAGLTDHGLYDVLYAADAGATFHGVGVDLDGDGQQRMKLYVHVDRAGAPELLRRVAERMPAPVAAARQQELLDPVDQLLTLFAPAQLAPTVELAVAYRDQAPPTIKVTSFLSAKTRDQSCVTQLVGYLERLGYAADAVPAAVAALAEPGEAAPGVHPLHGVGIEVPAGARPKVNVYLEPTL